MEIEATNLHTYLGQMIELRKMSLPKNFEHPYMCLEDFVVQNGKEYVWKSAPKDVPAGTPKECFRNAYNLVESDSGLTYCEGYAMHFFPMIHAWAVTESGEVIDNTWLDDGSFPNGREYLGMKMPQEWVWETVTRKGTWGILDNFMERFPLLTGEEKIPNME